MKQKNICEDCGRELEKVFILTPFKIPVLCWICSKSECYKLYKKEYRKEYKIKI